MIEGWPFSINLDSFLILEFGLGPILVFLVKSETVLNHLSPGDLRNIYSGAAAGLNLVRAEIKMLNARKKVASKTQKRKAEKRGGFQKEECLFCSRACSVVLHVMQ